MELCKKITISGINGIRGGFVTDYEKSAEPFLAMRIFGIASGVEVKTTTYGESLKFIGEFKAINGDGEEFAAPVCYLPGPADDMLKTAILAGGGKPVNFAFDVFVKPTPKKTPVDRGYEFSVKPLLETRASDPLEALIQATGAPAIALRPKQAALPAEPEAPKPAEPKAKEEPKPAEPEAKHKNGKK